MKQVFCAFPPAHTLPQPPTNNQQQASSAQTFLRQTFHPSGSVSPDGRHDALHRRVPASGHPLSPTPPELVEESPARGGREAAVVHLLPRRSSSPPQLRRTRSRAVVSHPCSRLPLRAALAARGWLLWCCCGPERTHRGLIPAACGQGGEPAHLRSVPPPQEHEEGPAAAQASSPVQGGYAHEDEEPDRPACAAEVHAHRTGTAVRGRVSAG